MPVSEEISSLQARIQMAFVVIICHAVLATGELISVPMYFCNNNYNINFESPIHLETYVPQPSNKSCFCSFNAWAPTIIEESIHIILFKNDASLSENALVDYLCKNVSRGYDCNLEEDDVSNITIDQVVGYMGNTSCKNSLNKTHYVSGIWYTKRNYYISIIFENIDPIMAIKIGQTFNTTQGFDPNEKKMRGK